MGVVVNRYRGKKHELKISEIRSMLDAPILTIVPEDPSVPKSIRKRKPVVHHKPRSRASSAYNKLASRIVGENFVEKIERFEKKKSWFDRLTFWLR